MWNILKESVLRPRYAAPQCRRTFFSCGAGSWGPWGLSPRSFSRETAGSQLGVAEHFSGCSRHSVQCGVVTNDLSPRPERISVPSASPPPPCTHALATPPLTVKGCSLLTSNHVVIFWGLRWWPRDFTFFCYHSEIWLAPNLAKNRQYISSSIDLKIVISTHEMQITLTLQ